MAGGGGRLVSSPTPFLLSSSQGGLRACRGSFLGLGPGRSGSPVEGLSSISDSPLSPEALPAPAQHRQGCGRVCPLSSSLRASWRYNSTAL